MSKHSIIAIDPGVNGGIASIVDGQFVIAVHMPGTEGDIIKLLRDFKQKALISGEFSTIAVIEKIPFGGIPNASALAKLHSNAGFIRGVIQTLAYRVEMVDPKVWQEHFHFGKVNDCKNKTAWKNKLKSEAQRIYPALSKEITLATADALLILEWADSKFNRSKLLP